MIRIETLWRVYDARSNGDWYLGAVRAATQEEALAAARERWCSDDPLPWQVSHSAVLRVEPA